MNTGQAQTAVVTTMAAAGVLVFVRAAQDGRKPAPRQLLGIGVAGTALSFAAQLVPQLAGPVALLWLTGEVFMYGGPAFTALTGGVTPAKARSSSRSSSPARSSTYV